MSKLVNPEHIKVAMAELRSFWNDLYNGTPKTLDPEEFQSELKDALGVARKVARISDEAYNAALSAFQLRARFFSTLELSSDAKETLAALQESFEVKLAALRQLESGDHILPRSALDLRKSAASDLDLYNTIIAESTQGDTPKKKSFKTAESATLEAVEFLLRLGAAQ